MRFRLHLLGFALLFLGGCAYFNTFYNLQLYFRMAEERYEQDGKVTPQNRSNYRRVIEKGSKILEFYPNSRYVDDALYYMGISYMRLGEISKARRKFQELLNFFPESPFVPRVHIALAKIALEERDLETAREELKKASGYGKKYENEVNLLLAEAYFEDGNYESALEVLRPLLGKPGKDRERYKTALFLAVRSAIALGRFQEAEAWIERLQQEYLTPEERRTLLELSGDLYTRWGRYDEALEVYQSLDLDPNSEDFPRIELKIGQAEEGRGNLEEAKKHYRTAATANQARNREEAVQARILLAQVLERQDSLEAARRYYDEASKVRVQSPLLFEARRRRDALDQLLAMKDSIAAEVFFRRGELFLFSLNQPEEAVAAYQKAYELAKENGQTSLAARSLYALAYIHLTVLPEPGKAQEYYQKLLTEFGGTIYAQEAERNLAPLFGNSTP